MNQWVLQLTSYGTMQLVDPDGSVVATYNRVDPLSALADHLRDGDQISVVRT